MNSWTKLSWETGGGPPLLREMARPPAALYVRGDAAVLTQPSLAVVGTRRPTGYGLRAATVLARDLARAGWAIVSGLARGIDGAAHRGAMAGGAPTIAVLGHGPGRIYPPEHTALAEQIVAAGGCLVTEYEPEVPPVRHHFPERNRIIAALSLGTVVIEAAERSGSLLTARHAMEANREVFVVPGVFDDPGFLGGHRLVQDGAKLVMAVSDILAELPERERPAAPTEQERSAEVRLLEDAFRSLGGAATLEEIFNASALSVVDIARAIEAATDAGFLEEIGPQRFLWIGPATS